MPPPPTKIFISYSREQVGIARRLAEELQQAGFAVWWDISDLKAGVAWERAIETAIKTSQYCLILLTPDSVESEWVRKEYMYAISLQLQIIPILYQDCEIPLGLTTIQYLDFRGNKYKQGLFQLLVGLKKVSGDTLAVPNAPGPTLKEKLLALSRDQIWQMLGVIVAVMAFGWGVYTFYLGRNPVTPTPTPTQTTTALAIGPTFPNAPTSTPPLPTPTPTFAESPTNVLPTFTQTPTPRLISTNTPVIPTATQRPTSTFTAPPTNTPTRSILTSTPTSSLEGHIVFASTRRGNPEIYIMNANGTGQTRITSLGAPDLNGEISPDGQHVAVGAYYTYNLLQIYVVNIDGSNLTELASVENGQGWPFWSSDGQEIFYTSNTGDNNSGQIFSINLDGREQNYIADLGVNLPLKELSLSPDGQKLILEQTIDDERHTDFYTVGIDGSNLARLTNRETFTYHPAWSPNGNQIAFASGVIWIMNADGTNTIQLPTGTSAWSPSWSPNGQWIAFNRDENIYVIRSDGADLRQITFTSSDHAPSWGP